MIHPTMEIDRSDTWVKARQDENGNYLDDDVKTIAENIVSYSFQFEGNIGNRKNLISYILFNSIFYVMSIL